MFTCPTIYFSYHIEYISSAVSAQARAILWDAPAALAGRQQFVFAQQREHGHAACPRLAFAHARVDLHQLLLR